MFVGKGSIFACSRQLQVLCTQHTQHTQHTQTRLHPHYKLSTLHTKYGTTAPKRVRRSAGKNGTAGRNLPSSVAGSRWRRRGRNSRTLLILNNNVGCNSCNWYNCHFHSEAHALYCGARCCTSHRYLLTEQAREHS